MKRVEKAMREVVEESVMKCASWYGFNGMEALRMLSQDERKEEKRKKEVEMVMPFVSELVREDGCGGLCYNRGLFTQCPKAKMETGSFCKTCSKEASGSESGKPLLGTVADRMSSDAMGFRDPKGRAPVSYSRIMTQMGLSRETVEAEAARLGVTIPEEHFAMEKKRGRPAVEKKRKAQAETVEDLLSRMVTESDDSEEVSSQAETVVMSDNDESDEAEQAGAQAEKDAQKAILKGEKEAKQAAVAAVAAEKEAKQAAVAAEKEAKAAKLAAEKEAKAAKLAEEKAEKEAKLAALAAEKEAKLAAVAAEKEAKLAAQKAEKEAKAAAQAKPKAQKEVSQAKPKASPAEAASVAASAAPVEAEPKPKKVTVTRITIEGVEYLKTAENLLYNPQTKEEMGIYDPESKTIKPLPEESDDELDEEDYESDGN